MSTTVQYKGSQIATVSNTTVTLNTSGTWLEDDITLTDVSGGSDSFTLDYEWDSEEEWPVFTQSYATIKAAVLAGKTFRYTQFGDDCIGAWWNSCYFTNYTYDNVLYTECLIFYLQSDVNSIYICVYGHEQGDASDSYVIRAYRSFLQPSGTKSITQNGNNIDVSEYEAVNVNVSGGGDPYTGDYEVTPTQQTQTLYTQGKSMTADVVINPIPSNYGLITWDGTKLMIS